jgi:hypothetical protein
VRRAAVVFGALAAFALPASAATPPPARVQVAAQEFSFTLSRLRIQTGPAILELANFGEDPHDLYLRREAVGAPTLRIRTVGPGKQGYLRARLAAGRFRLWCSLADHAERGMRASLLVTRP